MLGAIIGDIVGSRWEFNSTNDYDFELFSNKNNFTDDTICTIAIADAILKGRDYGESLHYWCRKYMKPKGGFGGRFRKWVESDDPKPYESFGNGSAMRVSPVGMWFTDDHEVLKQAELSAACTHNHPFGINGAKAVAWVIHCAIKSGTKFLSPDKLEKEILDIVVCTSVDNGFASCIDLDDYKNRFDETCQGTIPPAFEIINNSYSFEDAIRRAVSLGADADTLGAIVGSIAEHLWGIPEWMKLKAMSYLTEEMQEVVTEFYKKIGERKYYNPSNMGTFELIEKYNKLESDELGKCYYDILYRTTPEKIDELGYNEVFVFGSNKDGLHMGGAARAAKLKFGAIWGIGEGLQGKSYAIPTMDGLVETAKSVNRFIDFAINHNNLRFYVTPIGCGVAGYKPYQIAPFFRKAITVKNIYLPEVFWEYFKTTISM